MSTPVRDPAFVLEHQDFVKGLAKRLVFDDQLAEDLAQSTWLAALEHPPVHERSLRGWLATLVRNLAHKAQRAKQARSQRELDVARHEAVPSAEELYAREAQRKDVLAAVLSLDEPYRSALILRYFEGLSPRAIAARTGASVATVPTHLKRGLEKLRARLDKSHGSRAIWALAFVRDFKLPLPPVTSLAIATKALVSTGVMLMAGKKFALVSIALIVIASLGVWRFESGPARAVEPASPPGAGSVALATPPTSEAKKVEAALSSTDERAPIAAPVVDVTPKPVAVHEGSVRANVQWSDKTPAANVGAMLYTFGEDDPYRNTRKATTDAKGSVVFEHVPLGNARVVLDRNQNVYGNTQVAPGVESEVAIEVPRGVDVQGSVVDADERPVADADVFSTMYGAGYEGFIVARSDLAGRFFIRDIQANGLTYLSARAISRAPTAQNMVLGTTGQTLVVKLVFEAAGGEIAGRVVDADAHPIAGAQVLIGDDRRFEQFIFPDGSRGMKPGAQLVSADANGEYRVRGVEPGQWPLQVRACGFAPTRQVVDIVAGRTTRRDVELSAGCRLRGMILDGAGAPVAGVQARADTIRFAATYSKSKPDGSFLLVDLPVGEFKVSVLDDERGMSEKTLVGVAGAELQAEFVLATGNVVKGRIVARGEKLEDWMVEAYSMDPKAERYGGITGTDAEGRFTFTNCPDVALRISVRSKGIFPMARVEGVRPGPNEVVIEVDPTSFPSVMIRGRVLDEAGHPMAAELVPHNPLFSSSPIEYSDAQSGRFELGPYPTGEWSLGASLRGFATSRAGPRLTERNDVWDVGDLVLQRGATLVVHFTREGGGELFAPALSLQSAAGEWGRMELKGDQAFSEPLNAGRQILTLHSDSAHNAAQVFVFDARAGETSELFVVLRAGERVSFDIRGASAADEVEVAIRQAGGEVLAHVYMPVDAAPTTCFARLVPGHFLFDATAGDKKAHGEFDVGASGVAQPIVIELH